MTTTSWYPGHMARGMAALGTYIRATDLFLEVADARAPLTSRFMRLKRMIRGKPSILILHKADLANPSLTDRWRSFFLPGGRK